MNALHELHPFSKPPAVEVRGGVDRRGDGLYLQYLLGGELSTLTMPTAGDAPSRRDRLWETTCLECFFGRRDHPGYWEVNLSPHGEWNVYAFSAYRHGMIEETTIENLAVTVTVTSNALALSVLVPTSAMFNHQDALQVGLCAVLQEQSGVQSFWALAHPGKQPDFHDRRGFMLDL